MAQVHVVSMSADRRKAMVVEQSTTEGQNRKGEPRKASRTMHLHRRSDGKYVASNGREFAL